VKALVPTRHPQAKMRERAILRSWVEQTARNPQWTEPEPLDPTVERRFRRIAEFGDRALRVVCVETDAAIRVITATFDRGARSDR
jgi:hypothetical protein